MATTARERGVQQVVRRELVALGFSTREINQRVRRPGAPKERPSSGVNGSIKPSSRGLFNRRIRHLAQLVYSDASYNGEQALPEVARHAIFKFLGNVLEYKQIHDQALTKLPRIDVEDLLRPTAQKWQRDEVGALKRTSQANIVAFLKRQLGEAFATTFYLWLPPEESWRLFLKKVVAATSSRDQVSYRNGEHLCQEFAAFHLRRPLQEWPKKAMDLLTLGLTSLLCRKIDSGKLMEVYSDVFVRLFGLDGQPCSRDPSAMKCIHSEPAVIKRVIFNLEQALASPEAVGVFTVVAKHFSDEFAVQWQALLPISESMEDKEVIWTLDSPLRAFFAAQTYRSDVSALEGLGITNLRQLCLARIKDLCGAGLSAQVLDTNSTMSKRLRTINLGFGMSTFNVGKWDQPPQPP